jgi:hypothetical protein
MSTISSPVLAAVAHSRGCHWLLASQWRLQFRRAAFVLAVVTLVSTGKLVHAAEPRPLLYPPEGKPYPAQITGLDASGTLQLTIDQQPREVPDGSIVRWGSFVDARRGPQVLLVGQGLIVADEVRIEAERLVSPSAVFGDLKLPLDTVAGILFRPAAEPQRRDAQIFGIREATGETDRVILTNGDELTGSVQAISSEALSLETEAGKVDIDTSRLAAITFNPGLRTKARLTGPRTLVGFRDGSRVTASEISGAARLDLLLTGGVKLSAHREQLAALQPLGGAVGYLSDLKPVSFRHVPFLSLQWPYKMDRSVGGNHLRVGGELFLKGMGLHSAARLTFDLPEKTSKFAAELGIDDETGGQGSVVVRVLTDAGPGKWKPVFTSATIRGGDKPTPIEVDVSGAARITILVDYADHGDQQDHVDLLNARFVAAAQK